MGSKRRSGETVKRVLEMRDQGRSHVDIERETGVAHGTFAQWITWHKAGEWEETAAGMVRGEVVWEWEPKPKTAKEQLQQSALHPPADMEALQQQVRDLESDNARLLQQLTWAQHAESTERTGGLLTIRRSDDHQADKNHLLSCERALVEKACVLVEQYEPERIQIVGWDDWIAGNGIYKEQDLDCTTSDVNEQIAIGAIKTRRWLQRIRQSSSAPIEGHFLRGNHEYARGVSMAEALFFKCMEAVKDIPDVSLIYHWDNATINLASEGVYNVLVRHGFGYSKHSPNSPAFIDAIKDEIITKQRQMQPAEQYRRILSGHTHWLSVGLERLIGLHFDTTGGLLRNTRIRIGDNQRPVGWIVYVSPKGLADSILQPIPLQPTESTYVREIADPHLASANLRDAGECMEEWRILLVASGVFAEPASFGKLNEGRH